MPSTRQRAASSPVTRVLLLTNNDSDNVGDQIIEQSVISLVKAAFANLGINPEQYTISSRAIGIISQRYITSKENKHLALARKEISEAGVVIFGGAPVLNYKYQNFYLKTIKLIELAQEYDVPVLFSSIGVEPFDATDERSLELQRALSLPCVKRATTRDDIESLRAYLEPSGTPADLVADPAIAADLVFREHTRPTTGGDDHHRSRGHAVRTFQRQRDQVLCG